MSSSEPYISESSNSRIQGRSRNFSRSRVQRFWTAASPRSIRVAALLHRSPWRPHRKKSSRSISSYPLMDSSKCRSESSRASRWLIPVMLAGHWLTRVSAPSECFARAAPRSTSLRQFLAMRKIQERNEPRNGSKSAKRSNARALASCTRSWGSIRARKIGPTVRVAHE